MTLIYKTQLSDAVYANSGSAEDIQNAIDEAVSTGKDTVIIPEGTFLYPPEVFSKNTPYGLNKCAVIVPGGIKVFGAGMDKTILKMTEQLDKVCFFLLDGSNGKRIRVSGIKFKGLVSTENLSFVDILVYAATDFRVDHCLFEDFTDAAVAVLNFWDFPNVRGVVDHCKFDEPYKDQMAGGGLWGYGVMSVGAWNAYIDDVTLLLGKYENIPNPAIPVVYVEDCEANKVRYLVSGNQGGWYVVRHCTIKNPRGHLPPAGIDVHEGYPDYGMQGGLGCECYDNYIVQDVPHPEGWSIAGVQLRAGGGVIYNNTIKGLSPASPALALVNLIIMSDACKTSEKYHVHDTYIWNNTLIDTNSLVMKTYDSFYQENVHYFLYEKPYTPYPYPHPLTLEEVPPAYVTPWTGELEEGTYKITMPQQVQVGSDIYNFKQWEDGSINPVRTVNLTSDMTVTATYEKVVVTHTLTITTRLGGTTSPAPGSYSYTEGTSVTVTAIPDPSYKFANWLLDGAVRTENPITIIMDTDHTLEAVFEYVPPPPLTATIKGIITDKTTGSPIPAATVTCNGYADITETDGSYIFENIPAQKYTLKVTKEGYVEATLSIDVSAGGTAIIDIPISPTPKAPIFKIPITPLALIVGAIITYLGQKKG
jgi:hypothetical protein